MFGLVSQAAHKKVQNDLVRVKRDRDYAERTLNSVRQQRDDAMDLLERTSARLQILVEKEQTSGQFTQSEIRSLIFLCHPDRHNGRESAVSLTQKLISMRIKKRK